MQTNFNIFDYIDLVSLTLLIKIGSVCLLHFWVNFTQNKIKVCFKHYQNLFQDIPEYPINQKTTTKITLGDYSSQKRRGRGPARYDHEHRFNVFFYAFPNLNIVAQSSPGVSMSSNSSPSPNQNPLSTSEGSSVQDLGSLLTLNRLSPRRQLPSEDFPAPVVPSNTILGTS